MRGQPGSPQKERTNGESGSQHPPERKTVTRGVEPGLPNNENDESKEGESQTLPQKETPKEGGAQPGPPSYTQKERNVWESLDPPQKERRECSQDTPRKKELHK